MANSIKAAAARGARGLFVLGHLLLVSAETTTTTAASSATVVVEDCDGDGAIDACRADEVCSKCFSDWGAASSVTDVTCEDRFPGVTSDCEEDGASFCCGLGDEATANACMENALFVAFLGCFMEGFQCTIEDMPCYDGSAFSEAPSPAPTLAMLPSEQPTAFPSGSSSYADRGLVMTASPTSSPTSSPTEVWVITLPTALAEACAEEAAACVADETCRQGCVSENLEVISAATGGDEEAYSTCQLGYLLGDETSSVGSTSEVVCDVVSSAFCCSGSAGVVGDAEGEVGETDSSADCSTNAAAQDLWSCAFEFYECSVEDVVCVDDEGAASGVNGAMRSPVPGGRFDLFGVFCLNCFVAFVLGLVAVEF